MGYTYHTRGEGEMFRIDGAGEMEALYEGSVMTEDGSIQWLYYWKPCEVISYERFQELKQAEERRNREYDAKHTNDTRIPF